MAASHPPGIGPASISRLKSTIRTQQKFSLAALFGGINLYYSGMHVTKRQRGSYKLSWPLIPSLIHVACTRYSMLLLTHDGYQCMKSWLLCIVNVRCFCDFLLQCVFVCMNYMRSWRIASTYNYACVVRCVMLIKHDCTFKESLYSLFFIIKFKKMFNILANTQITIIFLMNLFSQMFLNFFL